VAIQLALLLEQRYQWAAVLAFTELQTDCDAPVSEFLWISNGLIKFDGDRSRWLLTVLNV
jgi:hypothetical protein